MEIASDWQRLIANKFCFRNRILQLHFHFHFMSNITYVCTVNNIVYICFINLAAINNPPTPLPHLKIT